MNPSPAHRRPLRPGLAQLSALALFPVWFAILPVGQAAGYTVVGWNNLGMHCMDSDYSVFAILPPYNTVNAQVIYSSGTTTRLLTDTNGLTLQYEALADPTGSYNSTSVGKGNFWQYVRPLFGLELAPDEGLPVPGPERYHMPGAANTPQSMRFETGFNWFAAYGIPITPYDDAGKPNSYPMLRLALRNTAGQTLATTRLVTPVSDEMDCKLCHASGAPTGAEPYSGWVNHPDRAKDYRLNILRLHDDIWLGSPDFDAALAKAGYHTDGLYSTVVQDNRPILCAACHLSEALPGSGQAGIKPLTAAVHTLHAMTTDPRNGLMLNAAANRMSCYACHPGSVTRCLRGAMGKAVAADGSMAMQCQSCHGSMTAVGAKTRTGWLDEPNCQACHTGDAVSNSGQIRYPDAFDAPGHLRVPTNTRFATSADTPAAGISLYRFSKGHGGLQCSACHGSTHAEYPAAFPNDNLESEDRQGHIGVLVECTACHAAVPATKDGGPHGMHPVGNSWARDHADYVEDSGGPGQCRTCHGTDYKGTVLSRMQADRTLATEYGSRTLKRGMTVSCYLCHNGPNSESTTPNAAPSASPLQASTAGTPAAIVLKGTDPNSNPLSARIVNQPAHGTVALAGMQATYQSEPGYAGQDTFQYLVSDGLADSAPATVTVTVSVADADGDGLPDWWTQLHFGHPTAEAADLSRVGDDPDRDGLTNLQEFAAGSDPLRGDSTLKMAGLTMAPDGLRLSFNTVLGVRYNLLASPDLSPGSWSVVATNLWGHPDSQSVADPGAAGQPKRYYRVEIVP